MKRQGEGILVLALFLLLAGGANAADVKVQLDDGKEQVQLVATGAEAREADTMLQEGAQIELESEAEEETEVPEEVLGQILVNDQIEDVDSLDATVRGWGLGKAQDEEGHPLDAVNAQEKYGIYNALFLGEEENTIYLTFDEGYENGYTESILDTLQEKDVKAVFFLTGYYAKSQPELVQRMIDEGHVIGNHTASHPSEGLASLSKEEQQNEVMENHDYILENFGYHMYLFRYPSGEFSEQSLAIVSNCNYRSVFWSFAYLDYDVDNQPDPSASLAKMEERLHPGAIYLLHAESETNASILGNLIDKIREEGYSLGTL
jgi:delta-lactam-biosynthetic de-N-acetylase